MNAPELETRLREAFAGHSPHLSPDLDPSTVLRLGGRRRHRRTLQIAAAAVAVLAVGSGVAVATVPPTGTILSPVVSALRRDQAANPWMEANSQRYLIRVENHGGTELTFRGVRLNPDGSEQDLGGYVAAPGDLPLLSNGTSGLTPGVTFAIFAAGSHDVSVQTPNDRYQYAVSSMEVVDPSTGARYVAVAIAATNEAITQINSYTWTDGQGVIQQRSI